MPPEKQTPPFAFGSSNETGMTLRDYFAAKAMQAYLSLDKRVGCDTISEYAYKVADAMLIQRNK
jgi:hypothetical protein